MANVGDSRCFLGQVNDAGKVTAVPLTSDHTPDVPAEAARIHAHQARQTVDALLCKEECGCCQHQHSHVLTAALDKLGHAVHLNQWRPGRPCFYCLLTVLRFAETADAAGRGA